MSKEISYMKTFKVGKGPNLRDMIYDLVENSDFVPYLKHMEGKDVIVSLDPATKKDGKENMYAYYQKVVLKVAVQFFQDMGWQGMDKDTADDQFKEMFSKDFVVNVNTGKKVTKVQNKRGMSKQELRQFIYEVIMFLEEHGYAVPESSDYKNQAITGIEGFKTVK